MHRQAKRRAGQRPDDSHRHRLEQVNPDGGTAGRAEAAQDRRCSHFLLQMRLDRARYADRAEEK